MVGPVAGMSPIGVNNRKCQKESGKLLAVMDTDKPFTPTVDQAKAIEPFTLRPDQEEDVEQILTDKRVLCANELGTGKTVVSVEAALRSGSKIILVVAPINTFTGWHKTVVRQTRGKDTPRLINSKAGGKEALQDLADGVAGWYMVNWEYMRNLSWKNFPVDYIALDESAKLSNRKSKQFLAAKSLQSEYMVALSATPYGNKVEGAFGTAHILWPKEYPYFWPFVSKFCRTELDPYAGKRIVGEKEPGAIRESMPSWMRRKAPYDLPLAIHEVEVDMSPTQRKVYQRFEEESVVWLADRPLIAELPAVQYMRLRQITLAVPSIRTDIITKTDPYTQETYTEEKEVVYFEDDAKSSKIDSLMEVIEQLPPDEPQLVWSHSKKFTDIVAERLRAKGYTAAAFTGDVPKPERERLREEFGNSIQFLCATIQSAGTGLDGFQDVCAIEHVLSLDDDRTNNRQSQGRLLRFGQTRTVNRFVYRAKDTIEVRQMGRLKTDEQMMDDSLEAVVNLDGKQYAKGGFRSVEEAEAQVIEMRNELFTHNLLDRMKS